MFGSRSICVSERSPNVKSMAVTVGIPVWCIVRTIFIRILMGISVCTVGVGTGDDLEHSMLSPSVNNIHLFLGVGHLPLLARYNADCAAIALVLPQT